jgi:predicted dehydrogenase/threonine dehydrogenase-like Zn-dependent dehydrogenase
MKQVLQSYRTGELWLADVPAPAPSRGGLLVRTHHSVVSAGTERMIIELAQLSLLGKARARPDLVKKVLAKVKSEGLTATMTKVFAKLDTPIALGYSAAGIVLEGSSGGISAGDRVACAGAGYATHAEVNYVPHNLCVKVPDGVSLEDAAFTTIGAIAMQGVRQAEVHVGERIVVIGLGLLGLLTVQILRASGCAVFGIDPAPERCTLAKELGADDAIPGDGADAAAASFTRGRGADAVIITAATKSSQPVELAAELCRAKGKVVIVGLVGMEVPRDPFYKKELDLRMSMSYGPGRYDPQYEEGGRDYPLPYVRWTEQRNMESFLDLVARKQVTPGKLVTHRFAIDNALSAYELLEGKCVPGAPQKYLGILLDYPTEGAATPTRTVELQSTARAAAQPGIPGIGFIGAGNFAKGVLIPALRRAGGIELVGVCTASGMSATETGKKHGFQYATTDVQQLLGDSKIAAVFIATRHSSHASLATAALRAGKHVFVEKPLCIKAEDLEEYRKAVTSDNPSGSAVRGCLMVGYNRRFSAHAAALRSAFAKRQTPLVMTYRVNAGAIPREVWIQDPEIGGGRIVGEACHFVDFCEAVIGSDPVRVSAASISSSDTRIVPEDSVSITINYRDGSLATIQYLAHGAADLPKERIEVCADGMSAITDDFRTTEFFGAKAKNIRGIRGKQNKGFDAEIGAFLGVVRAGGDWPIPLASLLRTSDVTFAVLQSLRSGQSVTLTE